tara:strand:- start:267 stop:431 length:165 start_codon:yes stop_codon:yes gene_type:complete
MWENIKDFGKQGDAYFLVLVFTIFMMALPLLLKLSIVYANKDWINPCQALEWCV